MNRYRFYKKDYLVDIYSSIGQSVMKPAKKMMKSKLHSDPQEYQFLTDSD